MGISLISLIVVLGVLIFVHESGHFLVARLFGVGVEKFSLGFGPRIFGKTVGRTDYRVSAIPLGGYVKMVGEDPDIDIAPEDIPESFTHKNVYQRMLIVAAGPFFNLLLAVMIFFGFFSMVGVEDIRSVVKSVEKGSPAEQAGIRLEDRIVAINGETVESWYDIKQATTASGGAPLHLTVEREHELFDVEAAAQLKTGHDILGDTVEYHDLGMSGLPVVAAVIGEVSKGLPAEKAGLKKGDRIIGINDIPVRNWEEMRKEITASGGSRLKLKIQRGDTVFQTDVMPQLTVTKDRTGNKVERYLIGISTGGFSVPEELRFRKRLALIPAVSESLKQTWFVVDITLRGIVKMIDGSISRDNLGGPIMIAQMAGQQAKAGIGKLIQFIAFISINLAILNFLPIPILDGGHLMFFSIEAVRGRPVSIRVREMAQQAGMFILLMLMVFVFYNDIARIFSS